MRRLLFQKRNKKDMLHYISSLFFVSFTLLRRITDLMKCFSLRAAVDQTL